MTTVWLVNGHPGGVDPSDRGLAYGDGLFETMAAESGRIRWFDYHWQRLTESCARLAIPPPERGIVRGEIAANCPPGKAVVKLMVTRGPGERGYARPATPTPTRILSISSWPDYPQSHYTRGVRLRTCELRLAENPRLAGMKHLCRLEQVLAQIERERYADAEEGLLLDASGFVASGIGSNVFAVSAGRLLTPALGRCGVKGVMRRAVLEAAGPEGLPAAELDILPATLHEAEEMFVTNAIFGIWPVRELDGRAFAIGDCTFRLMRRLGYGSHG